LDYAYAFTAVVTDILLSHDDELYRDSLYAVILLHYSLCVSVLVTIFYMLEVQYHICDELFDKYVVRTGFNRSFKACVFSIVAACNHFFSRPYLRSRYWYTVASVCRRRRRL